MLASPWPEPFDGDEWWFEVKWDGYRVLAYCEEGGIRLQSRRGNDLTPSFPELSGLRLPRRAVLDGEVVVFGEGGRPSFAALQQRNGLAGRAAVERSHQFPATFIAFDLLHLDRPTIELSLEERWALLGTLELEGVPRTEPLAGSGTALWSAVVDRGMEGIVAKRSGSRYHPGRRSPDWRKISHRRMLRAVVGGFLPGGGARTSSFASLLVGLQAPEGLRWIGAVGSGFDAAALADARAALDSITRPDPPFVSAAGIPRGAVWVEPLLVARVEYKEWTPDRHLRAPVFKGWDDAPVEEVTWESEVGS